jgi:hypothetical protein
MEFVRVPSEVSDFFLFRSLLCTRTLLQNGEWVLELCLSRSCCDLDGQSNSMTKEVTDSIGANNWHVQAGIFHSK